MLSTSAPVAVRTYVKFECASETGNPEQFFLYCSPDGWDLSQSLGECSVERTYTFDLAFTSYGEPRCEHVVNAMEIMLDSTLFATCSSEPVSEFEKQFTIVTMHDRYNEVDIADLWQEDMNLKSMVEQVSGTRVVDIGSLQQSIEFKMVSNAHVLSPSKSPTAGEDETVIDALSIGGESTSEKRSESNFYRILSGCLIPQDKTSGSLVEN